MSSNKIKLEGVSVSAFSQAFLLKQKDWLDKVTSHQTMIDCYKILIIAKLWDHRPSASFCSEKVKLDWRPLLNILQSNNHFEFIPRSSQSLQLVFISGVTLWRVNIFARPPKMKGIGLNFKAHTTSYRSARRFFRKIKEHEMVGSTNNS